VIPHFERTWVTLGAVDVSGFAVLVTIGVLVGLKVFWRQRDVQGLDPCIALQLMALVPLGGFVGAHLVERLIYHPRDVGADPLSLAMIWRGMSSFGGFVGGTMLQCSVCFCCTELVYEEKGPGRERIAGEVVPVDQRLAAGGGEDARQHGQRGRLAGAIGPEESHHLAARDAQRDAVDRRASRRLPWKRPFESAMSPLGVQPRPATIHQYAGT
jgi:prolipoprotein diacylglyceryl transferase